MKRAAPFLCLLITLSGGVNLSAGDSPQLLADFHSFTVLETGDDPDSLELAPPPRTLRL